MWDADGNRYLDCIGSWGPLILGHAHPEVLAAVSAQLPLGTTFGAPTALELEMAEALCEAVPSLEMVRLVSSGTEAVMAAIRVARGFTGRSIVVKFEGNYHGHADFLLAKAGSGIATLGLPECAGVPESITADTLTLPYNNLTAVRQAFELHSERIACVVLEPVAGNMGCVPPAEGFLALLRQLTEQHGSVLIFDEVMTGFRLAYGGAQQLYGVTPDMTTLGKIVGGGMPLAAYGGRADIMRCVAPLGPVYQAGTLSGNPVAVAAGMAALKILKQNRETIYAELQEKGSLLAAACKTYAQRHNIPVVVNQAGSMITVFFTSRAEVTCYEDAKTSDTAIFGRWFRALQQEGVYWPPSQFEAAFLSHAMQQQETQFLHHAVEKAFEKLIAV